MSIKGKAIKGGIWTLGQILFERAVQAIVFIIIAKRLGALGFGQAAIAIAPAVILGAGIQAANQVLIRLHARDTTYTDAAYAACIIIASLMSLIIIGGAALASKLAGAPQIGLMMAATAVVPLFYGAGCVSEAVLFSRMQFSSLALRRSVAVAIAGLACVAVASTNYAVWALPVQLIINSFTASTISLSLARVPFTNIPRKGSVGEMVRLLFPAIGTALLGQVGLRSVDVALGGLASVAAAGVYRMARTVLDLATSLFFNPISNVLVPVLSASASERTKLEQSVRRILSLTVGMMAIVFVSACAFFTVATPLLLPKDFIHLTMAGLILSPTIMSTAVIGVCHSTLIATERSHVSLRISAGATCLAVFSAVGLAHLGLEWVCAGLSISSWTVAGFYLWSVGKFFKTTFILSSQELRVCATAAVLGPGIYLFAAPNGLRIDPANLTSFAEPIAVSALVIILQAGVVVLLIGKNVVALFRRRALYAP
ncbi:oligosaccharide flippase family protein [Sphingomonas sp. NFX23]|uniref:oligosaccharide flippase family protein n=1 Tax=Sphingomonas sp. NFX23 TaxID=2819532 RepID=UPI003CF455B5